MESIGIDLGGHTISAALVVDGDIRKRSEISTPGERSMKAVADVIALLVNELVSSENISGVGIGVPGMLDKKREKVLKMPNFPGWESIEIKAFLSSYLQLPISIENDANCYALGEGTSGLASGLSDYVVFTLGTGIGGGIISDGRLLRGAHGMAGEMGHIAAGPYLPRCGCGSFGHIETISGADGIEKIARQKGLNPELPVLWSGRNNYPQKEIWTQVLDVLARGIASVVHVLDPEMVILGGGMSRSDALLEEISPFLDSYIAFPYRDSLSIRVSELGNDAAIIGAASLLS